MGESFGGSAWEGCATEERVLTVPWHQWRLVTDRAARFAGPEDFPVLACVHLVEIGGRLFAEATDRYTLGVAVAGPQVVPPEGLDVTVPVQVLRAIRKAVRPKACPGRTVVLRHLESAAEITVDLDWRAGLTVRFATLPLFPDLRRLLRRATGPAGSLPVRPDFLGRFGSARVRRSADEVAVVDAYDGDGTVVQVGDGDFFGVVVRPKPAYDTDEGEPTYEPRGLRDLVDLYTGKAGESGE